jgi:hypothetical protein
MSLPRGCLPTKAPQPPSGDVWLHEIKQLTPDFVAEAIRAGAPRYDAREEARVVPMPPRRGR